MEHIEKSIEVKVPVRTAYNQWTQFEDFPKFMEGVKKVKQLDAARLHWVVNVAGRQKEWDAEIVEQIPDKRISWRSISGTTEAGSVTFVPVTHCRTRIHLRLEYQ